MRGLSRWDTPQDAVLVLTIVGRNMSWWTQEAKNSP